MTVVEGIQIKIIQNNWMNDDELCHIVPEHSDPLAYCGFDTSGQIECKMNRKSICRSCGLPACPRCAQLESLHMRLGG